jgi:hypothetical protein
VRTWTAWHRHVTLAMLGAAVLTIAAAIESARGPDAAGQIPLTRNEIAHLLATVTASRAATPGTASTGHTGDAATSTAPGPATTSGK